MLIGPICNPMQKFGDGPFLLLLLTAFCVYAWVYGQTGLTKILVLVTIYSYTKSHDFCHFNDIINKAQQANDVSLNPWAC